MNPNLHDHDLIVINSSAGKDSMALTAYVARLVTAQGFTGPVVVLHNDLGVTRSGHPVEWPGVEALAREHAERYGFRFEVRRRERGGLWDQLLNERRKWMSSAARWCTSDQKTSQGIKLVTQLVEEFRAEAGITSRPVRVLYALGIRGEESDNRARKSILAVDEAHSSRNRTITRWHPIRDWTVGEVWAEIKAAGLRPHAAYSWGMSRLSCSLCVLASPEDLFLAAWLRPELASDYLWAEQELGHRFRLDLSMVEIVGGLHVAELEQAGNPDARTALGALAGVIRAVVQEQQDAKNADRAAAGKPPFPAKRVNRRTVAQLDKVMRCARRAVSLAPGRTPSREAA
ncbi:phosphoadenosine phosphosulfate reductase family protein [Sphaerimonospora mesophila]|uniref:phosphoadenosine phosphosulfate reductase domain-containing protein n=1 Tax=Sphaerimonospora mesophila TaxID=37483 RepID=UPI0006E1A805